MRELFIVISMNAGVEQHDEDPFFNAASAIHEATFGSQHVGGPG